MLPTHGVVFFTPAQSSAARAAEFMSSGHFLEAFSQLTAERLMAGVQQGMFDVGATTSLPLRYVENIIPLEAVRWLSRRIGHNVDFLSSQWQAEAGALAPQLAGMMDPAAEPGSLDISQWLWRLAQRLSGQGALAAPLRELSEDLQRWLLLLETCRAFLDDGRAIRSASRQRRLTRYGAIAAGVLVVVIMAVWGVRVHRARQRIDLVLEHEDPCAAMAIPESDLAKGTGGQQNQAYERRLRCAMNTLSPGAGASAASAASRKVAPVKSAATGGRTGTGSASPASGKPAASHVPSAATAAAEPADPKLVASCKILATYLERRQLPSERRAPGVITDRRRLFLARIARRVLRPSDLRIEKGLLPCAGTPSEADIGEAYARAAVTSAGRWVKTQAPSAEAERVIGEAHERLGKFQKRVLAGHAEREAKKALRSGDAKAVDRTIPLCRIARKFGVKLRHSCRAMLRLNKQ